MSSKIRLAVAGGRRGGNFSVALEHLADRLALTAVCDPLPEVQARWREKHPDIHTYGDFEALLASGDADALLLATPAPMHARQAVAAMEAGLDVLSEVPACMTHDEAIALVDAVRRTGRTYMLAENYCYRRELMMVKHMVDRGAMGELTYAEGMYLHELGGLKFNSDGSLTWRGEMGATMSPSVYYPTHSMGPVAQWMGINRDDELASVYALGYPGLSIANYARRRFGDDHAAASPAYWRRGDGAGCLIQTKRGRVIYLRVDTCSLRPHHMISHELQGTLGCFRTPADADEDPRIWLDGYSPGASPPRSENPDWRNGDPMHWQSL
ncbi:Gfo/Idh/MocA family protein, partial [Phycisphaerales bacterium AB-hyl4]